MNEVMNNILTRRSVRSYLPNAVPEAFLQQILTAGIYAPTGRNQQSPIILAVTDRNVRDRLSELNASVMGSNSDPFYGAPVVLVVLADRSCPTYQYDGCLVMQNLMLAAHSLGLGSCWIHRAKEVFEMDEGKSILRSLGISGDYEGIGNCILGYAKGEEQPAKPRKQTYVYRI